MAGLVYGTAAKPGPQLVFHDLRHLDLAVGQGTLQPPAPVRSAAATGQSRRRRVTQPANTRTSVV